MLSHVFNRISPSFIGFLLIVGSLFLGINAKACDTSPILTPTNIVDIGGGFFTFDMQVCIGENGSEVGFDLSMGCGLNVTATSAATLTNSGKVATASITGGVLTYLDPGFAATGTWWEVDDFIAGPCFNFTVTVDGDPQNCSVSVGGINDGCTSTPSTSIVGYVCTADFSITAPASQAGNTSGAGNGCNFSASEEQVIEVILPCDETYTFSLCGNATWDTYMVLSSGCCGGTISTNDDGCSSQSTITAALTAGTYYITIEGFGISDAGAYTLDVTQANPCPTPCTADYSITGPANQNGNTTADADDCAFVGGGAKDQIVEVVIPCDETWRFRTCHANTDFDTYMALYPSCCSGTVIASSDDACGTSGLSSRITTFLTAGTYYVTVDGFDNTEDGNFRLQVTNTGTACAVLPVQLLSFKGVSQNDNTNLISWGTSTEINNDFFTVERGIKRNGKIEWLEIGRVTGAGNSSDHLDYDLVDISPVHGISNYYRLNQTDFDGANKYSKIIYIDNSKMNDYGISNLYPNPTGNQFSFSVVNTTKVRSFSIDIYNNVGEHVKREELSEIENQPNFKVDVTDLSEGVYFVHVLIGGTREVKKLTVIR